MICLPVTFVHCTQTAEDVNMIYFVKDNPMSFQGRVKIWLTSVNHFLLKFCPKEAQPVDLSVGHIRLQNCGQTLRDNAMVTMERP